MSYIFLDESGDLGFNFNKRGTTHYFVVTFLFVPGRIKPIQKIVRKTFKSLPKKAQRKTGILHAAKEKPITRRRLLTGLNTKECGVMSIYLNKRNVYTKLQDEKHLLYNYVTNILLDRIYSKKYVPLGKRINLIASKRETNKFLNENFQSYILGQAENNHGADLKVKIKTPAEEKCLQATDFVSWSMFRKYEYGDDSYYNIIKPKIIEESPLFP